MKVVSDLERTPYNVVVSRGIVLFIAGLKSIPANE
jgi:hypothetical protein